MRATGSSASAPHRRFVRILGFILGILLVVAALAAIVRSAPAIEHLKTALAQPAWQCVAAALVAALANVVLSGGLFYALMRRHGIVGFLQMQRLVAASTLLNYAPLRPGLVGRIAYQQAVCGIPVRRSVLAVVEAAAICGWSIVWLALSAVCVGWLGSRQIGSVMLGAPILLGLACVVRGDPWWKAYAEAAFWRWLDALAWIVRYWAVFSLVGVELSLEGAATAACIGLLAGMVPFVGSGLGIREWAIGLAGPALAAWPTDMGLAADLINRAVDLVIVVPLGLVSLPRCLQELRTFARVKATPARAQ
ncbi:MAG: hypothetical protein EXS03_08355 [Phycisphaerales bacterium]|nr:hypothetical protein [Phycisphaerales bacterium]